MESENKVKAKHRHAHVFMCSARRWRGTETIENSARVTRRTQKKTSTYPFRSRVFGNFRARVTCLHSGSLPLSGFLLFFWASLLHILPVSLLLSGSCYRGFIVRRKMMSQMRLLQPLRSCRICWLLKGEQTFRAARYAELATESTGLLNRTVQELPRVRNHLQFRFYASPRTHRSCPSLFKLPSAGTT